MTANDLHLKNHQTLIGLYGVAFTWGAVTFQALSDEVTFETEPVSGYEAFEGFRLQVEASLFPSSTYPETNDTITDSDGVRYRVVNEPKDRQGWPFIRIEVVPYD